MLAKLKIQNSKLLCFRNNANRSVYYFQFQQKVIARKTFLREHFRIDGLLIFFFSLNADSDVWLPCYYHIPVRISGSVRLVGIY